MIAPVIHWYFKQRYQDIQLMASRAADAQDVWFEYLLDKGKDTVYGESAGFKNIRNYAQWKEMVPVANYEDLKPWIER
ncbi:MAG: GH3 auxin-responsive promoter family protein, partial [Sphingomonadales bacterium]